MRRWRCLGDEDKRDEGDEDVMGLRLGKRRSSEFGVGEELIS